MKSFLSKTILVGSVLIGGVLSFACDVYAGPPAYNQVRRIRDMTPASKFAQAIEDLPLMPGLEVESDHDMLFIFGSDRIAQTTVAGKVDVDEVYYFYQATLPQLGWSEVTPRLYERQGEQLHIDARSANADGTAHVRFEVVPDK